MRWLQRLIHRLVAWMTPPDVQIRLDRLERALMRSAQISMYPPVSCLPHCGHETTSWFQDVATGTTRCPACHAKAIAADEALARALGPS